MAWTVLGDPRRTSVRFRKPLRDEPLGISDATLHTRMRQAEIDEGSARA